MVAAKEEVDNVQIVDDTPNTPDDRHMHKALITLLDGNKISVLIDRNAKGGDLLEKVVNHLNILEQDYFSLAYTDHDQNRIWLYNEKKISKQLQSLPWNFDFLVKFYPPEPSALQEDITRFYLCLQIQRDVVVGKLPCSLVTYALLGSYLVQSQLGDYEPMQHGPPDNYLAHFQFSPSNNSELTENVHVLHKTHKGQTPAEAELHYLENAKKLAMYGIDLHSAKDAEGNDVQVGVCSNGLMVFRDRLRIHRFAWPKILKISYRRNNFYIKTKPGEFEQYGDTVCYKVSNFRAAKRLWKASVEHHTFFRLMQPEEPPRKGLFRWGSTRFRYSGRTQFQTRMASQMFDRPAPSVERSWSSRLTTQSLDATPMNAMQGSANEHELRYADATSRDALSAKSKSPLSVRSDDKQTNGIENELQQYPDAIPCSITIEAQPHAQHQDPIWSSKSTSDPHVETPLEKYHSYLRHLSDKSQRHQGKENLVKEKKHHHNKSNMKKVASTSSSSLSETSLNSGKNISSLCGLSSKERNTPRNAKSQHQDTPGHLIVNSNKKLGFCDHYGGEYSPLSLKVDQFGLKECNILSCDDILALNKKREQHKSNKLNEKASKKLLKKQNKVKHSKFGFGIANRAKSDSISSRSSVSSISSDESLTQQKIKSVKPTKIDTQALKSELPSLMEKRKKPKVKLGYADVSGDIPESQIQADLHGLNDMEGLTPEQLAALNERREQKKKIQFEKKEVKRQARHGDKDGKGKSSKFGFGFGGFGRRGRSDSLSSISSASSSGSEASSKQKKLTAIHVQAPKVDVQSPKLELPSLKKKGKKPKVKFGYADVSEDIPESQIQADLHGLNDMEGLTPEQLAALHERRELKKKIQFDKKEVKRQARHGDKDGKGKSSKFGFGFGGFGRRGRSDSLSSISSASSSSSEASSKQQKLTALHVQAPKVDVQAPKVDLPSLKKRGKKPKVKLGYADVSGDIPESQIQADLHGLNDMEGLTPEQLAALHERRELKKKIQFDNKEVKRQARHGDKDGKGKSYKFGFGFGGFGRRGRSDSLSSISSASSSGSEASSKQQKMTALHVQAPKVDVQAPKVDLPSLKKKGKEPKVKLGYADVSGDIPESHIQADLHGLNDMEGLTPEQLAALHERRELKKKIQFDKKEVKRQARHGDKDGKGKSSKFGFGFGGFGRRGRSDSLSSISSASSSGSEASSKQQKMTALHVQAPKVDVQAPKVDLPSLKKKGKEPKVKLGYADVSGDIPESQIQADLHGLNDMERLTPEQLAALHERRELKKKIQFDKKEVKRQARHGDKDGKGKSSKFGFGFGGFGRRGRSDSLSSISSASSSGSEPSSKQKKVTGLHVQAPKVDMQAPKVDLPSLKKKEKEPKVKLGYADVSGDIPESQIQADLHGLNDMEGLTAEQLAALHERRELKKKIKFQTKEVKRRAKHGEKDGKGKSSKFGFGFGRWGRSDSLSSISSASSSGSEPSSKQKKVTALHVQAPKVDVQAPKVELPSLKKKGKEPKVKFGYADVSGDIPESQIQADLHGLNDMEGLTSEQLAALHERRELKKKIKFEKKEIKRQAKHGDKDGKGKSSKFGFGFGGFGRRGRSDSLSSISSASSSGSEPSSKQKKVTALHVQAPKVDVQAPIVDLPSLKKKGKELKVKLGYADVSGDLPESQIQADLHGLNDMEGLTAEQLAALHERRELKKKIKFEKKEIKRQAKHGEKDGKGKSSKFGFGFGRWGRSDSLSSISSASSSGSEPSSKQKKVTALHVQAPKVDVQAPKVELPSLKKKGKKPKVKLGYADVSGDTPESQIQADLHGLNDMEGLTPEQLAALHERRELKKKIQFDKKEVKRQARHGDKDGKGKSSKFGFGFGGFGRRGRSDSLSSISSASSSGSETSSKQKKLTALHVQAPKVDVQAPEVDLPSLKKKGKEPKVKLGYADVSGDLPESQIQADLHGLNDMEGLTAEQLAALHERRELKKKIKFEKKEIKRQAKHGEEDGKGKSSKFGFGFGRWGRSDSLSSISSASSSGSEPSSKQKKVTALHVQAPKVDVQAPKVELPSLKKKGKKPKVKLGYADVSGDTPESQIQADLHGLNDMEGLTPEQLAALHERRELKKKIQFDKKEVKRQARHGDKDGKGKSSKFGFGFGGFGRRGRSDSLSSISSASSSGSETSSKQRKLTALHVQAPKVDVQAPEVELPSLKKKGKEPKAKLGYADVSGDIPESQIQADLHGLNDMEGLTPEQLAALHERRELKKKIQFDKKEVKRQAKHGEKHGKGKSSKFGFGFGGFGRWGRSDSLSSISSASSSGSETSSKQKKLTALHVQAPKVDVQAPKVDLPSLKKKGKEPKVKLGYADVSGDIPESQIQADLHGLNDMEGLTPEQLAALNERRELKKKIKFEKKAVKRQARHGDKDGKGKSSKFGFGFGGFGRRGRSDSLSSISSASSSGSETSSKQKKLTALHVQAPKVDVQAPEVELPSLKKKGKEPKAKLGYADVSGDIPESQIQADLHGLNDMEGLTPEQLAALHERRELKKKIQFDKKEVKRQAKHGEKHGKGKSSKFGFGFGGFGRWGRSDSLSSISSASSSGSETSSKQKKLTALHVQAPKVDVQAPEVELPSLKKKGKEPKVKLGYADVSGDIPESQIQADLHGLNDMEGLTAEQLAALHERRELKKKIKFQTKEVKRRAKHGEKDGKGKSSKFGFGFGGFGRRGRSDSLSSISSASSSGSEPSSKQKKVTALHVQAPKVDMQAPKVDLPSLKKKEKEPKVKLGYADVSGDIPESQIQADLHGLNDMEGLTAEQLAALHERRELKKKIKFQTKEVKRRAKHGEKDGKGKSSKFGFGFGGFGRRGRSDSLSSISSASSSGSEPSSKQKKLTALHVQAPKVDVQAPKVDLPSLKKKGKEPKVKLGYADVSGDIPESQIQADLHGLNDMEGLTPEQLAALNERRELKKKIKFEKKAVKRQARHGDKDGKGKSSKFGFGFGGFGRRGRSDSLSSISSASSSGSETSSKQKKLTALHVQAPKVDVQAPEVELPSLKKKGKEPKAKLGYADVSGDIPESQIQADLHGLNDMEGLTPEQLAALHERRELKKKIQFDKKEVKRQAKHGEKHGKGKSSKFGFGFGGFGRWGRSDSLSSISSASSSGSETSSKQKKLTALHVQAPKVDVQAPEVELPSLKKKGKEPKVKLGYADVSGDIPESQIQADLHGLNDMEGLTPEQLAALHERRELKKKIQFDKKEVKRQARHGDKDGKGKSSKFGFGFGGFGRRGRSDSLSSISSASSSGSEPSSKQKKVTALHVQAPKVDMQAPKVDLPSLKKKEKEPKVKLGYADVSGDIPESQIQADLHGLNDMEGLTAEQLAALHERRELKKKIKFQTKEVKRRAKHGEKDGKGKSSKFGFGFGRWGRSDSLSSISSASSSGSEPSSKQKKVTALHVQAPKVDVQAPKVELPSLKKKGKKPKVKLGYADVSGDIPESQIHADLHGLNDMEGLTSEQLAALHERRELKKKIKFEKKEIKRQAKHGDKDGKGKSSKFGFGFGGFGRRGRSDSLSSISSASSRGSEPSSKQKKVTALHVQAPKVDVQAPKVDLPSLKKKGKEPKVKLGYADVSGDLPESQIQADLHGLNDMEGLTAEQLAALHERRELKKKIKFQKKAVKRRAKHGEKDGKGKSSKFGFGFGRWGRSDSLSSISSASSSGSEPSSKQKKVTALHVQ